MSRRLLLPSLALAVACLGATQCSPKQIVSVACSPPLLFQGSGEAAVQVTAVIAFNTALLPGSVNVIDFSGPLPVVLGSLAPAGIEPGGQVFAGMVSVDTSVQRDVVLVVSAAYDGDPLRVMSDETVLEIIPMPDDPSIDPDAIVVIDGEPVVFDRLLVQFYPDVTQGVAQAVADDVGATITSFEPVTNTYGFEYDFDPADPAAASRLEGARDELLAMTNLVVTVSFDPVAPAAD